jgi:hypothetical protein
LGVQLGGALDRFGVGALHDRSSVWAASGSAAGLPVLMSRRFADLIGSGRSMPVGFYSLKGFHEPVELHTPSDAQKGEGERP